MERTSQRKVGTGIWIAALGVLVVVGLLGISPGGAAAAADAGAGNVAAAGTNVSAPHFPTAIKHVFLIMMENEETNVIYGQQPYQTSLANTYSWGGDANGASKTGYYAVCHPSAPNYLALTSGLPLQCGSDGYSTYSVNNLGNLLQTAGESWTAWEENATVPCQTYNSGLYVVRHDPFPYYSDLSPNVTGGACDTHVRPIANLTNDFPYTATPPAFTYIAPDILNDAHSSSAAVGDWWLSTFVPNLVKQKWFASSVIFIDYDEAYTAVGNENFTGYHGLWGGPVYMTAVSPFTTGVGALDVNTSHYNLLSTMEFLLGLPSTGSGHDGTPGFPVMTGLFHPSLFGPSKNLGAVRLGNTDLAGYDLAGDNLRLANLAGADLAGANLSGANLAYANLTGADLNGADLAGARLPYATLVKADLNHADLDGATLTYADLQHATLRGASLDGAHLQYSNLKQSFLQGFGWTAGLVTNLNGTDLFQASLNYATCGSPNYIVASGANTNALGVPAACVPPL